MFTCKTISDDKKWVIHLHEGLEGHQKVEQDTGEVFPTHC